MSQYFRDRLVLVPLTISLVLNIVLWLVLLGKFGIGSERIPLHFNIVFGIDFVEQSWQIYQIPGTGLVILALNFWLGKYFYGEQKLFSYFLNFASLFVQIILSLAVFSLLVLIG